MGGLVATAATPVMANTSSVDDPTGDAGVPQADVTWFSGTYLRNSSGVPTIGFGLKTAATYDPRTDGTWTASKSFAAWAVDVNGDNQGDFGVLYAAPDGKLIAGVIRESDNKVLCAEESAYDAARGIFIASFPATCIGSPDRYRVAGAMSYETGGTLYKDDTAYGDWLFLDPEPEAIRAPTGYWMIGANGNVYNFGTTAFGGVPTSAVDIEATRSGAGYWILNDRGEVFTKGDAQYFGNASLNAGEKAVSLSAPPAGSGYWIFTDRGRVIARGAAGHHGDMSGIPLNGPVLDSVATPSGQGYFMVASDGGIFTFGDARFAGSMGGKRLNKPVMSMAPDSDGRGYWLVASDGGIFAFDANFHGSMGDKVLNKPISGIVPGRDGYLMVAEDGGIFAFGDVEFKGSLGANPPPTPIVAVTLHQ
jgi:hypothetical protein